MESSAILGEHSQSRYEDKVMEKKMLINEMKKQAGTMFATKTDIAAWFGLKDRHTVSRILDGVKSVDGKYYFIPEIADILWARMR